MGSPSGTVAGGRQFRSNNMIPRFSLLHSLSGVVAIHLPRPDPQPIATPPRPWPRPGPPPIAPKPAAPPPPVSSPAVIEGAYGLGPAPTSPPPSAAPKPAPSQPVPATPPPPPPPPGEYTRSCVCHLCDTWLAFVP